MEEAGRDHLQLRERDFDALREMANIGCGHAATALSRLMGNRLVWVDVPLGDLVALDTLLGRFGGYEAPVVVVALDVEGGLSGRLLLLLHAADARSLAGLLLGRPVDGGRLDEGSTSALCEVGNILASACLTAMGQALNVRLLPSVPRFAEDKAGTVLGEVVRAMGGRGDRALVLETRFRCDGEPGFAGHLLLLPELPSLPAVLRALGL